MLAEKRCNHIRQFLALFGQIVIIVLPFSPLLDESGMAKESQVVTDGGLTLRAWRGKAATKKGFNARTPNDPRFTVIDVIPSIVHPLLRAQSSNPLVDVSGC